MLIYNTTFQVDDDVHDNFLIWIKESYIPEEAWCIEDAAYLPDIEPPGGRKCLLLAVGGRE